MGTRIDKALRGLGIQSPFLVFDNLEPVGPSGPAGTDSAFTQSGPRPGRASTSDTGVRIIPAITGGQSVAAEVQVRRGGMPERRGAEFMWRPQSDNATEKTWRTWAPPSNFTNWIAAEWSDTDSFATFDVAVTRDTQQAVLVFMQTNLGAEPLQSRTFDFAATDPAWGAAVTVSVNPYEVTGRDNVSPNACTVVALPDGDVLAIGLDLNVIGDGLAIWSTSDAGTVWERYAVSADIGAAVVLVTGTIARMRAAMSRSDLGLMVEATNGNIEQWASSDLGQSWDAIDTIQPLGSSVSLVELTDGNLALGYIRAIDGLPVVRILSGAFSPMADANEVFVDVSEAITEMALAVDGVGNIWVVGRATASPSQILTWWSEDLGVTWFQARPMYESTDAATGLVNYAAVFCRGWFLMPHNWVASPGDEDDSIGTFWAAGWSSLSPKATFDDRLFESRHAWAETIGFNGFTGIPVETPQDTGWTLLGGAPTLQPPGELEFDTVASTSDVFFDLTTGAKGFLFEGFIISGTGSSTLDQVAVQSRQANGVTDFRVSCRFDRANSRIRVVDIHGAATIADISIDVSIPVQLMIFHNGGDARVFFKRPWASLWTLGAETIALTDGGPLGANNRIDFAHISSSTNTSRWRIWAYNDFALGTHFAEGYALAALPLGNYFDFGGQVTTSPRAIPEIGSETAAAFLSAERGPAAENEFFTVLPAFDFGIDRIFAGLSPSPTQPWRSTDLTEQRIVFDLVETQNIGVMWQYAFGLLNTNIRLAFIERFASGIWNAVGEYDASIGFIGLGYERAGRFIRPTTGSSTGGRYIQRNELAGGYAILAPGVSRRIAKNSPGIWADPTGPVTIWPELQLEGITGAEPASGTVTLVWANGVAISTGSGTPGTGRQPDEIARFWRLRIPVQDVVDSFYQVGNFVPTTVAVFGKQWSRGWSNGRRPNTDRNVSRRGTIRKRQRGTPADRWVLNWADGAFERFLQETSPNYLGHLDSTAPPVLFPAAAGRDDVWTLLRGLLDETEGGSAEVLALQGDEVNGIPIGRTTLTDRRQFLYSIWDSSVQANQVEDLFHRIDPITVNEQK